MNGESRCPSCLVLLLGIEMNRVNTFEIVIHINIHVGHSESFVAFGNQSSARERMGARHAPEPSEAKPRTLPLGTIVAIDTTGRHHRSCHFFDVVTSIRSVDAI